MKSFHLFKADFRAAIIHQAPPGSHDGFVDDIGVQNRKAGAWATFSAATAVSPMPGTRIRSSDGAPMRAA